MSREWLSSYTPRESLDRNSNFCTNIKEKRKRLVVTWSKLWTEIQHKYHRKNDLGSTAMLSKYGMGLQKADLSHLPLYLFVAGLFDTSFS